MRGTLLIIISVLLTFFCIAPAYAETEPQAVSIKAIETNCINECAAVFTTSTDREERETTYNSCKRGCEFAAMELGLYSHGPIKLEK